MRADGISSESSIRQRNPSRTTMGMATEAIEWLKNREEQQQPFFITLWTSEPHAPVEILAE